MYAIEQVLNLRLDSSAPGAANCNIHTLALQNEHGSSILELFLVLSQLHVFTEPVELGRGWRISGASRIPDLSLTTNIAAIQYTATCSLNVEIVGGMQWDFFDGQVCAFEDLRRAWLLVSSIVAPKCSNDETSEQQIALDVFLSHKKPEYQHIPSEKLGREGFERKPSAV